MTEAELADFQQAVDDVLGRCWGDARSAGRRSARNDLAEVWKAAGEHGWTGLAHAGAIDALLLAVRRLGRSGCPLPLADVYVAVDLLGDKPLVERILDARIRPVVCMAEMLNSNEIAYLDGDAATHVLVLDPSTESARLCAIAQIQSLPGMAEPRWFSATLDATAEVVADVSRESIDHAVSLMRVCLIARAAGAAARTHSLAIEYAKIRSAFGRTIGSYQAVSHRAVDGLVDVTAIEMLVDEYAARDMVSNSEARLTAEIAVAYGRATVRRIQFDAAHTLAAQGYFEEHEAPWLFRRVQADLARLECFPQIDTVADLLIDHDCRLPPASLGADADEFRSQVRAFLAPYAQRHAGVVRHGIVDDELVRAAVERGYLGMGWPIQFGGQGASIERQIVLSEEIAYHRIPLQAKGSADMFGAAIIRYGTDEQHHRFLPALAQGALHVYLGYSEPGVGSDLAHLEGRAVRRGDEWIVNARKMWGSSAPHAEYCWLAVRTDAQASPPHAGITVFLTKVTDKPGWEMQVHRALSGELAGSTFFDDFAIPDSDRIGDVNGGWKVITEALAQERVIMANTTALILRLFDDLISHVRQNISLVGGAGSARREALSLVAARIQAARLLVRACARARSTSSGGARLEAPMAKILSSLLLEDFSVLAQDILAPRGALGDGSDEAIDHGVFEYYLRYSIMFVVGGGTVDIQRNLVARSLGFTNS